MKDKQVLNAALDKLTYGFHILATRMPAEKMESRDKDYLAAGTVSWLMQASFQPPMITVALRKDSSLAETVAKSGAFQIHVLGKADEGLVERFSGDSDISPEQINDIGFELSKATGTPMLNCGLAIIECEVEENVVTNGDHMLFVGKVANAIIRDKDAEALHRWETEFAYGEA